MNQKNEILDAWIMIEHLSEGDINSKDKTLKGLEDTGDFYDIFKKEIESVKQNTKSGLAVYFGIFNFSEVVSILRENYGLSDTYEEIRLGEKFSFVLYFDKDLEWCSDMTFVSASAYIRWYREIPVKKTFSEYESNFMKMLQGWFSAENEKIEKKDVINAGMDNLLNYFFIERSNCRIKAVKNLEGEATSFHSFFIDDLENAKSIETDNLNRYILGNCETGNRRINLDSKKESDNFNPDIFEEILQPKNYPLARFPSNTAYSLSLMQQVAVNLAIGYDNRQIRSVNGPPGTGKTTLLKDIFAELVVKQAYDIANLQQKVLTGTEETRYYDKASIGRMPSQIAENGIVVASSNNSAVQNIVNELPRIEGVDDELSALLLNAEYFSEQIVGEENSGFWGNFSLEGGKSENMANIIKNLEAIYECLNDDEYDSEEKIYDEFLTMYNKVNKRRAELQEYADERKQVKEDIRKREHLIETYKAEVEAEKRRLGILQTEYEKNRAENNKKIEKLKKEQSDIAERKNSAEKNRDSLETYIQSLRDQKPSFFASRKKKRMHAARLEEFGQQLLECINKSEKLTEEKKVIDDKLQEVQNQSKEQDREFAREKQKIHSWYTNKKSEIDKLTSRINKYESKWRDSKIETLNMELKYDELQLSNPWFDEGDRFNQSKLFILALGVRKQFLYENRKNMKAAINIWNNQYNYLDRKELVEIAWNWINMAIPVISSTFASFSRMCKNMGKNSIGHLFIDEAGQALPQASVGAIYRSKHVMVVGDPAQIKPVLTLDSNVLAMLRKHFGVSEKYLSNDTSTQRLVDEISQYGFYKEKDKSDDSWIGIPLWVHRRCKDPMFKIANKISYNGYMVQGAPGKGKVQWYDVKGKADNKYVREQGEFLVEKIKEMIEKNPQINDKSEKDIVYVITPFSNVAYQLSCILNNIGFTRYDNHNKPTNVGTIHTFQGKEAPIVFLVLGADTRSRGAANWAVQEPNMMNVAATRAKQEFYIIGDAELYKGLGCAKDTYEIIEQYNKINNASDFELPVQ